MGNYVTQTDIEKRITLDALIELTDDNNIGAVDASNMNQCIDEAEGEVDGYLAKQYSVPLSTVPPVVKAMCLDMVVYRLYGRRPGTVPDYVRQRYEDAVSFFKRVADNKVSLGIDTEPPESPNEGGPEASKTTDDRTFTDDTLKNY